jgi:ABC-type sugar transport system permease subunit
MVVLMLVVAVWPLARSIWFSFTDIWEARARSCARRMALALSSWEPQAFLAPEAAAANSNTTMAMTNSTSTKVKAPAVCRLFRVFMLSISAFRFPFSAFFPHCSGILRFSVMMR